MDSAAHSVFMSIVVGGVPGHESKQGLTCSLYALRHLKHKQRPLS